MPNSGLTGGRIRQTRLSKGLRQAALAQSVGISPSYLNLIEHNRRRIGGKLLVDISRELGVEAGLLSEGAQSSLLEALGAATFGQTNIVTEVDRTEELVGRFPGWSKLIAWQQQRIESLEQTVTGLTDRLTHDPQLAASMHEMLSVVTAIRSTAAILTDGSHLNPEWQVRFHRNLDEDSRRLAENAQALVSYLDATDEGQAAAEPSMPKEELENWLSARQFHIGELEGNDAINVDALLRKQAQLNGSVTTMSYARAYLKSYKSDAKAVSHDRLSEEMRLNGRDPLRVSQALGCDLATVLRRIATQPNQKQAAGIVRCDSSGTLTFCKPIDGFALPRFGAACPLWPLYQALARPMNPIRTVVEQSGHRQVRFLTYTIAQPVVAAAFNTEPLIEATMLILPDDTPQERAEPVGSNCRICTREACHGRREPSILTDGF